MMNPIRAVVRRGKIELMDQVQIPEGPKVLVTPLSDESDFWLKSSESSLDSIWDSPEDDVYAKLLEK